VILALDPPTNVKELRHFFGMVQYYRACGKSVVKCWLLLLTKWESAEKQRPPKRIRSRRNLGMGSNSSTSISYK
jgi:hypothetical protein